MPKSMSKPVLEAKDGKIQATKHDQGKPRFSLIPARALREVAKVFTYGAEKYDVGNWHNGEGFDWSRLMDASDRHGSDFRLGQNLDEESDLHHLAHRICCDMMLLEHCLTNHGKDTRAKINYLPNTQVIHIDVSSPRPRSNNESTKMIRQVVNAAVKRGPKLGKAKTKVRRK